MKGNHRALLRRASVVAASLIALFLAACKGDTGSQGPPGTSAPPLSPGDGASGSSSGVELAITGLSGGTGPGGAFRLGDRISVTFTVSNASGGELTLDQLDSAGFLVSGPTFNYQRVIARRTDVISTSTRNPDGSNTYTSPTPIPSTYLVPLNDTSSFGASDGELSGQALLAGTYTVGLEVFREIEVDGTTRLEPANATADFLFGSATTMESREVVKIENCNRCHTRLEAHGGRRIEVKLCILCHTSGAEDRNVASVEGGTPGEAIEFRVMIHKIHNGAHLPSVLGVATNADGSRNYSTAPKPYRLVGFQDSVHDYSTVGFPVWPNLTSPMPRDEGYTALSAAQKATEDQIRSGVTACEKCHGDPDGAGPLSAPTQGSLVYAQPTRRACGSCHDDIDWTGPYTANSQTMPVQLTDSACALCHTSSGTALAVSDAHLHPLYRSDNPGLHFNLLSIAEAGANDGDGTMDPGEKLSVTFRITDDAGADVAPSQVASISVVVSGPSSNRNLLLSTSVATAALTGSQPFTIGLPQPVPFEFVGDATAAAGEVFTTSRSPHWNVTGATTTVFERTATSGGDSTTAASATALANLLDLSSTAGFARNDSVVVEDGVAGKEEYLQVALVDGSRLWFTTALRYDHPSAASVKEVTLTTRTAGTHYTLDTATGQVTEGATPFGDGNAVVVSYTSDFVMPSVFPPPLNDSPEVEETFGEWTGKSIVDGTYQVGMWSSRNVVVTLYGESQTYRATSLPANRDFLVGSATTLSPFGIISSGENCNACHNDVMFHGGGRRGFDTCVLCHGSAGSEDRARYTAANAPATSQVTIEFRSMLHKIHRGRDLAADSYTVVGFGASPYPNNFTPHTYGEVVFPVMPGGVRQCDICHGTSPAWKEPASRDHPSQISPTRSWYLACNSCHDSTAAQAHSNLATYNGAESCAVCHGPGREFSVEWAHQGL